MASHIFLSSFPKPILTFTLAIMWSNKVPPLIFYFLKMLPGFIKPLLEGERSFNAHVLAEYEYAAYDVLIMWR